MPGGLSAGKAWGLVLFGWQVFISPTGHHFSARWSLLLVCWLSKWLKIWLSPCWRLWQAIACLSLYPCDQIRTQNTVDVHEQGRKGRLGDSSLDCKQINTVFSPQGERRPVGEVCTWVEIKWQSAMVGQAWAGRACGGSVHLPFQRQKLYLSAVPKIHLLLSCRGSVHRSRHPETMTCAHLPSSSSHNNRHLLVRPWVGVKASGVQDQGSKN